MINTELYPWLNDKWLQIQSLRSQSRLPHALMIRGVDGLGLSQLATTIGTSLLCQTPSNEGYACGHCSDCHLIEAGTHPDLHQYTVPEDKKYISVEQIRTLVNVCVERPHQGGYRVAIIDPADRMTIGAVNALLKTLEEPGSDTLLILVTTANDTLPATVRSRCQLMTVYSPSEEVALPWLAQRNEQAEETLKLALRLTHQAPLQAEALLSSEKLLIRKNFIDGMTKAIYGNVEPIQLVANVAKVETFDVLDWMFSIALDAQKYSHQISIDKLVNNDQFKLVESLSIANKHKLETWTNRITEARKLLATSSNINPTLLLEDLMFRWIAIFK